MCLLLVRDVVAAMQQHHVWDYSQRNVEALERSVACVHQRSIRLLSHHNLTFVSLYTAAANLVPVRQVLPHSAYAISVASVC
jgi:hypothetical protein